MRTNWRFLVLAGFGPRFAKVSPDPQGFGQGGGLAIKDGVLPTMRLSQITLEIVGQNCSTFVPDECVLRGAAPDVPKDCVEYPFTLRVQVRAIRFTSAPSEVRMSTFLARASLVDVSRERTLWTAQCDLKSVDLPAVAGARTIPEINQMLERAAQRCANKLELKLQRAIRGAARR